MTVIVIVGVGLGAYVLFSYWYITDTQACMNNLTEILIFTKSILDDPDRANLWCPGLEDALALFDNQCSDLSELYIPPCL